MTWEVDSTEAARDDGVAADAAGGKPETAEPTGGSLREGTSTSSPSMVVSRGGSFGGGESIPPASSSSPPAAAAAAAAAAATTAATTTSSPVIEDGDGGTGDGDAVDNTASGHAKLPAELSKGEVNRLKSWGWRGETLARLD